MPVIEVKMRPAPRMAEHSPDRITLLKFWQRVWQFRQAGGTNAEAFWGFSDEHARLYRGYSDICRPRLQKIIERHGESADITLARIQKSLTELEAMTHGKTTQ